MTGNKCAPFSTWQLNYSAASTFTLKPIGCAATILSILLIPSAVHWLQTAIRVPFPSLIASSAFLTKNRSTLFLENPFATESSATIPKRGYNSSLLKTSFNLVRLTFGFFSTYALTKASTNLPFGRFRSSPKRYFELSLPVTVFGPKCSSFFWPDFCCVFLSADAGVTFCSST